MTRRRQEQVIMMDDVIRAGGLSGRQAAAALGVTEGALRYRRKRLASEARDRRADQPTALDGYEAALDTVLEALAPTARAGRPISARLVFEALARDHGFAGRYPAVVRALRKRRGIAPVRALRRVELPPGLQAQHDWFEERVEVGGAMLRVYGLLGTLSHSRASAVWLGRRMSALAWQTGHAALFHAYGGVPRHVRVDNLKTAVAAGSGPWARLTDTFADFAKRCHFTVEVCHVRTPREKGKVERRVRVVHEALAPLFRRSWQDLPPLQHAVTARLGELAARLRCPATGTTVQDAHTAERTVLQPLPFFGEPFDVIVPRRVQRDGLVSFEGRQYSVPFAWIGREVEVVGMVHHVVIRGDGSELARHPRHTAQRLLIDDTHYDGPSTATVLAPPPLGARTRAALADRAWLAHFPAPQTVARPLAAYAALVDEVMR